MKSNQSRDNSTRTTIWSCSIATAKSASGITSMTSEKPMPFLSILFSDWSPSLQGCTMVYKVNADSYSPQNSL